MKNRFIDFKLFKYLDWPLIVMLFGIATIGIMAVANATASLFTGEENTVSEVVANLDVHTIRLQVLWFLIGLTAMIIMTIPDYQAIADFYIWIYGLNILLLIIVFLASSETRGISGWFRFGERGFQPSEVAKVAIIITLAKVVSKITENKGAHQHDARIDSNLALFVWCLLGSLLFSRIWERLRFMFLFC